MIKRLVLRFGIVAAALTALATVAAGQSPPPAAEPPPFRLGLGDLMTAFVQPRHVKLGLGGEARNWDYASYEWDQLRDAFGLVEKQKPIYHNIAMSDLLQIAKEPMAEVQAAIKAHDGKKFDAAYGGLTDACNACHVSTDHAMIVMQVPKTSMFPDQTFALPKP